MINYKHDVREGRFGCWYHFDNIGDAIPSHSHENTDLHHTVKVIQGSVRVQFDTEAVILHKGDDVFWFDNFRPHSIVAVLPRTVIFNEYIQGKPVSYNALAPTCLEGTIGVLRSENK
jgi:hypothetical protein